MHISEAFKYLQRLQKKLKVFPFLMTVVFIILPFRMHIKKVSSRNTLFKYTTQLKTNKAIIKSFCAQRPHVSIFNTPLQAFFNNINAWRFFWSLSKLLLRRTLAKIVAKYFYGFRLNVRFELMWWLVRKQK